MRKEFLISFIIFFILFSAFCSYNANAQLINSKTPALIERVIDGDTIKIIINGKRESIRLIGIDAPESRKNRKAYWDARRSKKDIKTILEYGKRSTNFVKTLVKPGDRIYVEFDIQHRDKYGRLLGYVYLKDGRMLNEEILKAGYATLMTVPPNIKYVSKFYEDYLEARKNKRGLWNN